MTITQRQLSIMAALSVAVWLATFGIGLFCMSMEDGKRSAEATR